MFFEGFDLSMIDTGEAKIRVRHGGVGPPLLLLHGHPQTHMLWYKIAPRLAQDFTVVAADLRGYGESSKPPTTPDHEPYSKRAMARDMVAVMRQLGFEKWSVAGHDRGGYVSYRMALDFPERVEKLATLDIIPAGEALRRTDMDFARGYWHWFFLSQPADFPEQLIGANPDYFYSRRRSPDPATFFDPAAYEDIRRSYSNPATIHAMCEDYRANVSFDYELDQADRGKKRIACPTLALWAGKDDIARWYDPLAIWRDWADDVQGHAIGSSHFMPVEAPDATYDSLFNFFSR